MLLDPQLPSQPLQAQSVALTLVAHQARVRGPQDDVNKVGERFEDLWHGPEHVLDALVGREQPERQRHQPAGDAELVLVKVRIDERRVGDSEDRARHVHAGRHLRAEVPLPDDPPGGGVERVEVPVRGRDIEQVERGAVHAHVAREHGRRGDHRADVGRPDLAETTDVVRAEHDFVRVMRRSLEIETVRRPVRLVRERRRGGRRDRG